MKVLFIGHYRDGSGWAIAAQHFILALDAVGVDVVPRYIKLNDVQEDIPERIVQLEKKSDRNCDVVIQNTIPQFFNPDGHFKKNIGLYLTEVSHFKKTGWTDQINMMDEVWVTCEDSLTASLNSHVEVPVHIVPVPCDVSKYAQRWEPMVFPELEDKFVFYFIGECTRRKNIIALIKAFHLEFDPQEEVGLLIKGSYPGLSPSQCSQRLVERCKTTKEQLRRYNKIGNYKPEVVLTQRLTSDQIMQLHATGNCFVMPSFGEGWCIPAF
ncbi:MAG: glycosyltransferase, partial [Candidatus Kariarchaeaceae archaeon]